MKIIIVIINRVFHISHTFIFPVARRGSDFYLILFILSPKSNFLADLFFVCTSNCNNQHIYFLCCRKEDVVITNKTAKENNLIVEYFVRATYNSENITVPQIAVEATLVEYEANITQDLGVEVTKLSSTFYDIHLKNVLKLKACVFNKLFSFTCLRILGRNYREIAQ